MWYDDDDNGDGHLLQLLYEAEAYSFKLNDDNKCNVQIYEAQLLFCGKKGWKHEHLSAYAGY